MLRIDKNQAKKEDLKHQCYDLCDFSDTHIVVKGDITLTKDNVRDFLDIRNRSLAFKNNAPFTNCISKINNVLIDNAEDLDIVMPVYNLLSIVKITEKQQEVCGIITGMNLIILLVIPLLVIILLLLLIMQTPYQTLSLLNTKEVLPEKH